MPAIAISVRVPQELRDRIAVLAKAERRSVAGQTEYLIERGLASLNALDSEQGRDLAAVIEAAR